VSHALGFVRAWEAVAGPGAFTGAGVDLGSGGGLPGLVLALAWPESAWVLLDSHQRAVTFLEETVGELGLAGRVDIVRARAEEYGRGDGRGRAALVVARGFGAPAVTAECAAPLLAVGGRLVVSEPPEAEDRWPADGLAPLGLRPERLVNIGARFQVLVQGEPCPVAYPRRTGVPSKRPLF
jgi:16S rRNA (guanine527-N7)-methyltransferase